MKKKCIHFLFCFLVLLSSKLIAQPFSADIAAFQLQDAASFPQKKSILFIGSSSFTKWKDVQNYFPGYPILNRGFGGSSLPDVIRYADKIIFPYEPKQIVIYCGENDLAASDTVTADMVVSRFDTLFSLIRNRLPNIPIVFVSLKPSPSRQKFWPKMEEANEAIKAMMENENNAVFVDVYHLMFNEDGSIKKEIFLSDNLHMNAKGYAIWQSAIAPYLLN